MHCPEFSNFFTVSGDSSPGFSMLLPSMVCTCNSSSENSSCATRADLPRIACEGMYLGVFLSPAEVAFVKD